MTEPESVRYFDSQRPKNNHNRMITGIGTPSSQSRIPRPMFASLHSSIKRRTPKAVSGSLRRNGKRHQRELDYQCPVLDIEVHGSAGGNASPFCSNSIECRSGERTNAICPRSEE